MLPRSIRTLAQVQQYRPTQPALLSLNNLSWREFEQMVGEAFRRQGYDVEETGIRREEETARPRKTA